MSKFILIIFCIHLLHTLHIETAGQWLDQTLHPFNPKIPLLLLGYSLYLPYSRQIELTLAFPIESDLFIGFFFFILNFERSFLKLLILLSHEAFCFFLLRIFYDQMSFCWMHLSRIFRNIRRILYILTDLLRILQSFVLPNFLALTPLLH